jgi:predicted TIM-barrel fold metal-dependent hydrolase
MLSYSNLGYGIIDADQHWDGTDLPHDMFAPRLATKYRDGAPSWVTDDEGSVVISFNDGASTVRVATDEDTYGDLRKPSGVTVAERLHNMDLDGVQAAVLYSLEVPIHEAYGGDRDMIVALIEAYNDYKVEEISQQSDNRLFTLAMLPRTGVKDAVAEMQRCIEKGHKGVTLIEWPSGPAPSSEDDYFWAAAVELGVPVCIHTGSKLGNPEEIARAMHQWAVAARFPGLRLGLIEQGAGWIPYFLQSSDWSWLTYRENQAFKDWLRSQGKSSAVLSGNLMQPPSESFRQIFYASFLFDPLAVRLRDVIGFDKLMWSTDFPHGVTSWPRSRMQFDHLFGELPANDVKALVHDNAIRFYGLTEVS